MNADMYCDILKQNMIASLRRLGRRAVFQHNNHCLTKEAKGKGDGLARGVLTFVASSLDINGCVELF